MVSMETNTTMSGKDMGIKVLVIVAMAGALAIALAMQGGVVGERKAMRENALTRTIGEWGGKQRVAGPFIRLPYSVETLRAAGGEITRAGIEGYAYLLPDKFKLEAALRAEPRTRGIYEVPLYVADIEASGSFSLPAAKEWLPPGAVLDYSRAELCFLVDSARGLASEPRAAFAGIQTPLEGAGSSDGARSMDCLRAPVALAAGAKDAPFTVSLSLRGGGDFGVFPSGDDSDIRVRMDRWTPEFFGDFLPQAREVGDRGFSAEWKLPSIARSARKTWTGGTREFTFLNGQFASFRVVQGLDAYQLADRALKYGFLFIIVPFIGLFLWELFAKKALHPLQYFLVGCASALFYMILLSLSERMPFAAAFAVGGAATSALIGAYCAAVLKGGARGLFCGLGMAGLYVFLYFVIGSEDDALLAGTTFLFALLAAVMIATRKVDWYTVGRKSRTGGDPADDGELSVTGGGGSEEFTRPGGEK